MSFDVPVLLIAWRRPETTIKVIDAMRCVAPKRVFVACDGPRPDRPDEAAAVQACRDVVDKSIDWPCFVERHYQDFNLGCRRGVSEALNWFYSRVDEGIVLEDDCVPHADFFPYCEALLSRYRDDPRVCCISGDNFQDGSWRGDGSYYFSVYNHVWGWASWRRAWLHYDSSMSGWRGFRDSGAVARVFNDPLEVSYWTEVWDKLVVHGVPDTWDYQWMFACVVRGGLTALPNRNLVVNIGFGEGATHTTSATQHHPNEAYSILPLTHPSKVERDHMADTYTFDHHFGGIELREQRAFLQRVRRTCQQLVRRAYRLGSE